MKELLEQIEDNTEYLHTLEGEVEVECISIENLKSILRDYKIVKK